MNWLNRVIEGHRTRQDELREQIQRQEQNLESLGKNALDLESLVEHPGWQVVVTHYEEMWDYLWSALSGATTDGERQRLIGKMEMCESIKLLFRVLEKRGRLTRESVGHLKSELARSERTVRPSRGGGKDAG